MAVTFDFAGKAVFVVGGTSGINLGIAKAFARWGSRVAVASRNQEKVDAAVAELKKLGPDAFGVSFDVREYDRVKAGFTAVFDFFGAPIDILVSGAAGNIPARVLALSPNALKSMVSIDLIGTYNVMHACHEFLKKPGASVINISAPQAFSPMTHQSAVCAAKAGVDMVTKTLAIEWGRDGIRVNSISPGPIQGTEGFDRLAPTPELKDMAAKSVPLGRVGNPDDIAMAAAYLSSEMGSYVTGAVLPVDGGWGVSGHAASDMNRMGKVIDQLQRDAKSPEPPGHSS